MNDDIEKYVAEFRTHTALEAARDAAQAEILLENKNRLVAIEAQLNVYNGLIQFNKGVEKTVRVVAVVITTLLSVIIGISATILVEKNNILKALELQDASQTRQINEVLMKLIAHEKDYEHGHDIAP